MILFVLIGIYVVIGIVDWRKKQRSCGQHEEFLVSKIILLATYRWANFLEAESGRQSYTGSRWRRPGPTWDPHKLHETPPPTHCSNNKLTPPLNKQSRVSSPWRPRRIDQEEDGRWEWWREWEWREVYIEVGRRKLRTYKNQKKNKQKQTGDSYNNI